MAGVKGRSGGHNRLTTAERRLRGAKAGTREAHTLTAAVADVMEVPAHLDAETARAWKELAGRYAAAGNDAARIEVAAVHLRLIRRCVARLNLLDGTPGADSTRLLRTLRAHSEAFKGALSGCRLVDVGAVAAVVDDFAQFDH